MQKIDKLQHFDLNHMVFYIDLRLWNLQIKLESQKRINSHNDFCKIKLWSENQFLKWIIQYKLSGLKFNLNRQPVYEKTIWDFKLI